MLMGGLLAFTVIMRLPAARRSMPFAAVSRFVFPRGRL
jgi:hypothetical protein